MTLEHYILASSDESALVSTNPKLGIHVDAIPGGGGYLKETSRRSLFEGCSTLPDRDSDVTVNRLDDERSMSTRSDPRRTYNYTTY